MSNPLHQFFKRSFLMHCGTCVAACLMCVSLRAQMPFQNSQAAAPEAAAGSVLCNGPDSLSEDCQSESANAARPQAMPRRYPSSDMLRSASVEKQPLKRTERTLQAAGAERLRTVEPPTEFQQFVQLSTGRQLPIFGTWLFDDVPSTFAPDEHTSVPSDYVLGPGDEINLRIWGQINADRKLTVDRQGNLFVPQVGRVNVAGVRFSQLGDTLKASIGRVFRNFELSVDMGDLRSIQILVMGRARRPGTYTVSSLSTLVNALFASGGPSPDGSMRNIQVRRSGGVVTTFDLYDLLLRGDKSKDVSLQPGDVIFIPPAGARVAVSGSVETAAIFEITPDTTLSDLLSFSGGLSSIAAAQHAILQRVDHRATLESRNIALDDSGLCTTLQDGDIVSLLQVVPKFDKTVALKGNVADPVRLPWHEGMKISDVIPNKEALLTRDYWKEHNRLSSGSGEYSEATHSLKDDSSLAAALNGDRVAVTRQFKSRNDVQLAAPEINWTYAAIERRDAQTLATRLVAFNLGKVVIDHDPAEDKLLQPGDIITVFSCADFVTPQAEQTRLVRLEGEVKMAGIYAVKPGETLRDLVARAGGLTDKAYVYGTQFTREATRREQEKHLADYIDRVEHDMDSSASALASQAVSAEQEAALRASLQAQRAALERLRARAASGRIVLELKPDTTGLDAFPELPLENGDRLMVPSTPSTVSVVGTVYNESTFLFHSELTVRDCLQQAGGPTRYADRSHMFVLRADGSVIAKAKRSSFEGLSVFPGDAVIVPTNALKTNRTRSLLEASQMASGFGMSAAAITAMHP